MMRINQSYHNNSLAQYTLGVLFCSAKKVCTNLANTMNIKYDAMYYDFKSGITSNNSVQGQLNELASSFLDANNVSLIIDDCQINKFYARAIEGVEENWDSSIKKAVPGLKMVTALLTDGKINIPINAIPYVSKKLTEGFYKTKSAIAISIIDSCDKLYKIKRFFADAHYATKEMLKFLKERQINYLMKIHRNRIVTIGKKTGQLQDILRLTKNNHTRYAKGSIGGIQCYFYVIKHESGKTIYYICNSKLNPKKVQLAYKTRWTVETFHRTGKQYLGMGDCQMRAIEKQRQHVLHVMLAYGIASIRKAYGNFSCVEDAIKDLRIVKSL
jgi:hypothetical protein